MKNITKIRRETTFFPCGLEIPENQIFASPKNLGLSLMSALTGNPIDEIQVGRTDISIGLGCFGLIGIANDEECLPEEQDWGLYSMIGYTLYDDLFFFDKVFAKFNSLCLSISPAALLSGDRSCLNAVQFFGPSRLLKKLKSERFRLETGGVDHMDSDISSFISDNCEGEEPRDAQLTPPEEEFELFWDAKNPGKKFRILLNMITTFASALSAKLSNHGYIRQSCIFVPTDDAQRELHWFNGKLGPLDKALVARIKDYMKKNEMRKSDVLPVEVRELIWPSKSKGDS